MTAWRWKLAYCQSWRGRVIRSPRPGYAWTVGEVRSYVPVWYQWAEAWIEEGALGDEIISPEITPDDAAYEDMLAI